MIEKVRNSRDAVPAVNNLLERVSRLERLSTGPGTQRVVGGGGFAVFQPSKPAESRRGSSASAVPANIRISPEFPGAVVWADPDSANGDTGTMNGAFDDTNCRNAYSWTTTEATLQEYCVVVRIPVPTGFSAWSTCEFVAMVSAGAGAGTAVVLTDVYDTTGTSIAFVDVSVSANAWTDQAFTMPAGTYTAGGFVTLVFRLRAISDSIAYLGDVKMDVS
jgi:hypothetical protein